MPVYSPEATSCLHQRSSAVYTLEEAKRQIERWGVVNSSPFASLGFSAMSVPSAILLLLLVILSLALSPVEAQQPMAHSSLSPPTAYQSQQPMGYAGIVPSAGSRPVGTTNLPAAWTTAAHGGDDPLRRGREGPGPGAGIPPAMPTSTNLNYQGHDQAGWNNPGKPSNSRDR